MKVLVTGASGFIGARLIPELLKDGHSVRSLSRRPERLVVPVGVECVAGDVFDTTSLAEALKGIDVAYYLIHSMEAQSGGGASFVDRDRQAAVNFSQEAAKANVKRIVYLGGLGETGKALSKHLASRMEVGRILQEGSVPTTVFRAAIIVGAWGSSFDMIRMLVQKLPVMICPKWVNTACQPISLADILYYLVRCLETPETIGKTFDIGGPDVLSYREMMQRFAAVLNKPLWIFGVPILTPKLSSYWVHFVTPVRASLARPLIEGLRNQVICREESIHEIIPHQCLGYEESIQRALDEQGHGTIKRKGFTYRLEWKQLVAYSPQQVVDFFGNPKNLAPMTPEAIQFELQEPFPDSFVVGTQLNYKLRILGVPVKWSSEITGWNYPHSFSDRELRGPYRMWNHTHRFTEVEAGTLVEDEVDYQIPLGVLGLIAHPLLVGWQLRSIFRFRSRQLVKLLQKSPA